MVSYNQSLFLFQCPSWLGWLLWTECLYPPQIQRWKRWSHCDGIWEIIGWGHGGRAPWWNWCPYKGMKRPETSLSLGHVRKPESGLPPDLDYVGLLILDFPAARTETNKCMLFKSLSLWYPCDKSPNWLRHWLRALLPYPFLLGLKLQGHLLYAALKMPAWRDR